MRRLHAPDTAKAAKVRADLKALGLTAYVRRCTHAIRVILPDFGSKPEVADALRDYMVLEGLTFAGGSCPTRPDWRTCWSHFDGRAQFFLYDIR